MRATLAPAFLALTAGLIAGTAAQAQLRGAWNSPTDVTMIFAEEGAGALLPATPIVGGDFATRADRDGRAVTDRAWQTECSDLTLQATIEVAGPTDRFDVGKTLRRPSATTGSSRFLPGRKLAFRATRTA